MSNVKDIMIRKPSLKYRDVPEYEGAHYDWAPGEYLLKKGTGIHEVFHPLEHDIRFIKDEQVPMRDGVKILTDVYLPAGCDQPLPAIIAWSPYGKHSGNAARYTTLFRLLGLDQKRMSGLQKFEGPDPDFWCVQGYAIVHPTRTPAASPTARATAPCWAHRRVRTATTWWNGWHSNPGATDRWP